MPSNLLVVVRDNFLCTVSECFVESQILWQVKCPVTYLVVCKETIECPGIRYLNYFLCEVPNPLGGPVSRKLEDAVEREVVDGGLCVVATNESRCVTCSLLLVSPAGYSQR